jgi:hypothetical protein
MENLYVFLLLKYVLSLKNDNVIHLCIADIKQHRYIEDAQIILVGKDLRTFRER